MRINNIKAQSALEYTMLILIAAAALIAMTTYIMRSTNARLIQTENELNYYRLEDTNEVKLGNNTELDKGSGVKQEEGKT